MKLNYKNIRLLFFVLGAICIAYILFGIIKGIVEAQRVQSTDKARIYSLPKEYARLFNLQSEMVKNEFTELNTVRYPVSYFDYNSNKYCIIVTKINATKNIMLNKSIKEAYNVTDIEESGGYLAISQANSYFYYLPDSIKMFNIFLSLNGDSIKTITKNDSIASYYLKMKSFSVNYKIHSVNELFGIARDQMIPTCISIIKRNDSIYFILMSINYNDELKPDLLNNLLLGIR